MLSPDGSASEISYSTNSAQAHKILGGRPTIIGQLEQIGVVIVRSLDQSSCGPLNKNVLPAPFCNASYNGAYLLFAVDSDGFSKDFSLSEYEKYSKERESETERAQKEFDGNGKQLVSSKSALASSFFYDLTKVYIQSEIDKKMQTAKILAAESVSALVEEFLSADSSPMNDADYEPNEEEEHESVVEEEEEQSADDWRKQLEAALVVVRERGRSDGQYLAERVSATFYELNGAEPSMKELRSVFDGIEQDLANEAEEDMENESGSDALRLAQLLASNLSANPDPTELVEYAMQIVGMDLVSRAKAAFASINGRGQQPNAKELRRSVEKLAMKLAEEALSVGDVDVDADVYDPENTDDQMLARIDAIEDEQFNADHFNLKMLTTASRGEKGKYEAYDVYFSNFDAERERKNFGKAIDSFVMRNGRSPSDEERNHIRAFLSTKKETQLVQFKLSVVSSEEEREQKEKEEKATEKLLVTPVKKKKSAARFNVYFDDRELNQKTSTALKWFERFNNRKPTALEMSGIEAFIQTDKSELIECEFDVKSFDALMAAADDDSKEEEEQSVRMKMGKAVTKNNKSTKYTLDFAEESRSAGDAKMAMKWFERFNGRQANEEEQQRIQQFVEADNDNEQTIDID